MKKRKKNQLKKKKEESGTYTNIIFIDSNTCELGFVFPSLPRVGPTEWGLGHVGNRRPYEQKYRVLEWEKTSYVTSTWSGKRQIRQNVSFAFVNRWPTRF